LAEPVESGEEALVLDTDVGTAATRRRVVGAPNFGRAKARWDVDVSSGNEGDVDLGVALYVHAHPLCGHRAPLHLPLAAPSHPHHQPLNA
jgi:hypothetical protein